MGRLLVSVRGPKEAVAAAEGGADIADVEYPASALGTPYPLNIKAVRDELDEAGFRDFPISTNIGEEQRGRSTACQAALGVAVAGANYVKCGFAGLGPKGAAYLGRNLVRTVKTWHPDRRVYPAVFPEGEFAETLSPLHDGPKLVETIGADGLLVDTFRKEIGMGLLDYLTNEAIEQLVAALHARGKEAWVAGSLTAEELPKVHRTGVDVVCVRGAACEPTGATGRFGQVSSDAVARLVEKRL